MDRRLDGSRSSFPPPGSNVPATPEYRQPAPGAAGRRANNNLPGADDRRRHPHATVPQDELEDDDLRYTGPGSDMPRRERRRVSFAPTVNDNNNLQFVNPHNNNNLQFVNPYNNNNGGATLGGNIPAVVGGVQGSIDPRDLLLPEPVFAPNWPNINANPLGASHVRGMPTITFNPRRQDNVGNVRDDYLNPLSFNSLPSNAARFNAARFNAAPFNAAAFNPAAFNPAPFNPAAFNPAAFNPNYVHVGNRNAHGVPGQGRSINDQIEVERGVMIPAQDWYNPQPAPPSPGWVQRPEDIRPDFSPPSNPRTPEPGTQAAPISISSDGSPQDPQSPPDPATNLARPNRHIETRMANAVGGYGALVAGRPPAYVQWPRDIDIGLIEICTFFPNWLQIPDVIVRAMSNGWLRQDLARAQLFASNQLNQVNQVRAENRIQKQMSQGGMLYFGLEQGQGHWDRRAYCSEPVEDLTANQWDLRDRYTERSGTGEIGHVLLSTITAGVPDQARWPKGRHALLLTRCLKFAVDHPEMRDLDTSHFQWIIDSQNLYAQLPATLETGAAYDRACVARQRLAYTQGSLNL